MPYRGEKVARRGISNDKAQKTLVETFTGVLENFWNKVEERLKFLEECHAFYIILEKVIVTFTGS